jgi:formate hydrogenlyase subunit 3/multisubunit Na+/H+ antiporter MnhD subunit
VHSFPAGMLAIVRQSFAERELANQSASNMVGSVLALRQARLKLLIAYSTIAQIGYLFLMFPVASGSASPQFGSNLALTGGFLQAMSHAFAKAAMFMSAGLMAEALGHDRIAELRGVGQMLPVTVFAFGTAALSLIGLPPSGGFVAKWLLLTAVVTAGQWWWAAVMLGRWPPGGRLYVPGTCPCSGRRCRTFDSAHASAAQPGANRAGPRSVFSLAWPSPVKGF